MAGLSDFSSIVGVFGQRNFRIYITGSGVSNVGLWIHKLAVGWLAWQLTGSGSWLGLIAFADLGPAFFLTPLAGVLADRANRLTIILVSQSLQLCQAIVLCVLTAFGWVDIWSLFGLTLFLGIVTASNTAARLSVVPALVSREHLSSAIALDATLFNLARIVGPALAGVIIVTLGIAAAFAINALSFIVFLYALARLRQLIGVTEPPPRPTSSVYGQIVEGLRFAYAHPGIRRILLLLCAMAFGVKPILELLPGFADVVFGRGAEALSLLTSATGVGALISSAWLAKRGRITGLTRITMVALGLGGGSILAFTATENLWLAMSFAAVAGFAIIACGVGCQTLMQSAVEESVRGRVMSLYGMIFRGAPAVGALAMGVLSEAIGLQLALALGGVIAIAAGIWLLRKQTDTLRILETRAIDEPTLP